MPELADPISRVAGKSARYEQVSEEEFASECRKAGELEPLIAVLTSMYRAVVNGEFERVTDHVEQLTGQPAESA